MATVEMERRPQGCLKDIPCSARDTPCSARDRGMRKKQAETKGQGLSSEWGPKRRWGVTEAACG